MNGPQLRKNLWLAEQFVAEGEQLVDRQRRLVERLEQSGGDATNARRLLESLERSQSAYVTGRDRLRVMMERNQPFNRH